MVTLLLTLLIVQLLGTTIFGRFETETPILKRLLKWAFIDAVSIKLYFWIGEYAILFPLSMVLIGTVVHFCICNKYGFHPLKATPRKKYYAFRNWKWEE